MSIDPALDNVQIIDVQMLKWSLCTVPHHSWRSEVVLLTTAEQANENFVTWTKFCLTKNLSDLTKSDSEPQV